MLSSQEMRKVLDDVLEGDPICPDDATVHQDLSGVLEDLPDLEGECSILSLGWDENPVDEKETVVEVVTDDSSAANTEGEFLEQAKKSPRKEISCWSKVKAREKHLPESVPIQKGDMIEFLLEDKTWFLVEVTGRGKAGGKNRNYLNVKYSDGSEGGIFIDKHQWRNVDKKEVVEEVRTECSVRLHRVTVGYPHGVTENDDNVSEKEENVLEKVENEPEKVEKVEKVPEKEHNLHEREEIVLEKEVHLPEKEDNMTEEEDNENDLEILPSESENTVTVEESSVVTIPLCKDRKRRKRKNPSDSQSKHKHTIEIVSDDLEQLSNKSEGDPASTLRRGDIVEFLVEEEDDLDDDTWFIVEVLGRGKARGKNRNYLNVRYKDKSEGGVFIDKHQWRLVRRADGAKEKQ